MRIKLYLRAVATTVALAVSLPGAASAGAYVNIQFCNNYGRTLYFAIAYPQTAGDWISRGWMSVNNGQCSVFDSALHVPTFYVRVVTDWFRVNRYRRQRETWGGQDSTDRSFDLVESSSGSFNYYQAETKFSGVPSEPFFKFLGDAQVTLDGDSTATITFHADGTRTSSIAPVKQLTGGGPQPSN